MRTTRCKMTVTQCKKMQHDDGTHYATHLELDAVTDGSTPENESFWEATPSGRMSLEVNNVSALPADLEVGDAFYVDLIPITNPRKA